ncbi:nuclear transport factor 2 family protein [Streptomyces umbrinus]|uniref:nuclear transport factor 2 family protein n=1 Tax=Streptomyces umbrinus TaxID=67370 RepID=UPI003C2CCD17
MEQVLNPQPSWATKEGLVALRGPDSQSLPGQAADKILAAETLHRFGFAYDEQNAEAMTDCFTEDAVLTATTAGTRSLGTHTGREAVVGWLSAHWGQSRDQRRHIVTNAMVDDLTADSAQVTTMLLVTAAENGQFRPVTAGVYRATVRKESDGAWRIARFALGFDASF